MPAIIYIPTAGTDEIRMKCYRNKHCKHRCGLIMRLSIPGTSQRRESKGSAWKSEARPVEILTNQDYSDCP